MKILELLKESFNNSVLSLLKAIFEQIPYIIVGIVIIIIGVFVAKIFAFIVGRVLKAVRFDSLVEKANINEVLNKIGVKREPHQLVAKLFYYLVLLFVVIAAFDLMKLNAISDGLKSFLAYLPNLAVALLLILFGYLVADLIRRVISTAASTMGSDSGKFLGNLIFYFLMMIIIITGLDQAGVNTSILSQHLTLIIGGIILAFAVGYGIASRNILANLLSSVYSKKKFKEGHILVVGDIEGEVIEVDNISITLKTESGKTVIPLSKLTSENVVIRN